MSKEDSLHVVLDQLLCDFQAVLADSERLLQATSKEGAEALAALRSDLAKRLHIAKGQLKTAEKMVFERAAGGIAAAEDVIRANPWQTLLAVGGVAALIGYLAGRAGSGRG